MSRLRALCAIVVLAAMSTMFIDAGASAASPPPAPTFTITPNPVEGGNEVTFSGTGCLPRTGDPAGTPVAVYLSVADYGASSLITASSTAQQVSALSKLMTAAMGKALSKAAPAADDEDSQLVVPRADGTWSFSLDLPDLLQGDFTFDAVCDGYNWSFDYQAVTLTVTPNPDAALIVLPDFDDFATPQLRTGTSYDVVGLGFDGDEHVRLEVHSVPVVLDTFVADGGVVFGSFTLPADTAAGAHTLILRGVSSGITATLDVVVLAPSVPISSVTVTVTAPPASSAPRSTAETSAAAATTPTSTTSAVAGGTQNLAATGTTAGQMLWFGLGLTLLGAATVLFSRRRTDRLH